MRKAFQFVLVFASVVMLSLPGDAATTCWLSAAMGQCQPACTMMITARTSPNLEVMPPCCCGHHGDSMTSMVPQVPAPTALTPASAAQESIAVRALFLPSHLLGVERPHRPQAKRRVLLSTFLI